MRGDGDGDEGDGDEGEDEDEVGPGTVDRPVIRTRADVAPPRANGRMAAHDLAGVTPAGDAVAVAVVGGAPATLLAFLSSGCATCAGFWEAFAAGVTADLPAAAPLAPSGPGGTRLVIVTRGSERESPAEVRRLAPSGATTVLSSAAFDDYQVPGSPYFVLVDGRRGRIIGEGAAASWPQVAELLRRAAADHDFAGARPPAGAERVDADLAAAGIGPGHPSLYPPDRTPPLPVRAGPPGRGRAR